MHIDDTETTICMQPQLAHGARHQQKECDQDRLSLGRQLTEEGGMPRGRPAEACLEEKVDSPDGKESRCGVCWEKHQSPDRATLLLQMEWSGCGNNPSMADQGWPGLQITTQESQAPSSVRGNNRMRS